MQLKMGSLGPVKRSVTTIDPPVVHSKSKRVRTKPPDDPPPADTTTTAACVVDPLLGPFARALLASSGAPAVGHCERRGAATVGTTHHAGGSGTHPVTGAGAAEPTTAADHERGPTLPRRRNPPSSANRRRCSCIWTHPCATCDGGQTRAIKARLKAVTEMILSDVVCPIFARGAALARRRWGGAHGAAPRQALAEIEAMSPRCAGKPCQRDQALPMYTRLPEYGGVALDVRPGSRTHPPFDHRSMRSRSGARAGRAFGSGMVAPIGNGGHGSAVASRCRHVAPTDLVRAPVRRTQETKKGK